MNATRQPDYKTTRITNLMKQVAKWKQEFNDLKRETDATIKSLSDENGALLSEVHELELELNNRKEQNSCIICTNEQGYITELAITSAYNERVPLQQVNGINLYAITKTPLYQKIPFLKRNGSKIDIDIKQYNKYKIVGGIL